MIPVYPEEIVKEMKLNKRYIPRKLKSGEKLRVHRKYWIYDIGFCKVKDIFIVDNIEYYTVSYMSNSSMYAVISYPLPTSCYEMLHNFTNIEYCSPINDKKETLYGAEIKYWFIINDIDFNDENYSGFLDKLHTLNDSKKYFIRRNKKKKFIKL